MKKRKAGYALAAAALLCLSGPVAAMAATVTLGDPTPNGIGYKWTVSMGSNDTTAGSTPNYASTVGAFSWNDPINAGDPIGTGWTHTSNWTALTLTQAANLTVALDRTTAGGGALVPAFSLYAGQQNTDNGTVGGYHTYNNAGNFDWSTVDAGADSSSLNYIGNEANLGGLSSISKTFSLGPGLYSLVFGGNPPGGPAVAQGYQATLTTAPAAVPLPAAVWLFGSGIAGLIGFARRRAAA